MQGDRSDRVLTVTTKTLAVLVALVATGQAALAGRFMAGDFEAIEIHTEMASVLGALVILTAIIAAARAVRRRSLGPELAVAGLLVAGTATQAAVANINLLAVHVPLGVAVIALSYYHVARTLRSPTAPTVRVPDEIGADQ